MTDSISEIISKLSLDMKSWSSLDITIRRDQVVSIGDKAPGNTSVGLDIRYVETALGQRLFDQSIVPMQGTKNRSVNYSDGSRCARVLYDTSGTNMLNVIISKDFAEESKIPGRMRPTPLYYYYVEKTPLYEAIKTARPLEDDRVLGRDCKEFLFSGVKGTVTPQDLVYCLDKATSHPLRVDCYPAGSERSSQNRQSRWEAKSLDEVSGGRHFPLLSEFVVYGPAKTGGRPLVVGTDKVQSLVFDQSFDASFFWPKYEPGVKVHDTLKHTVTEVPGGRPAEPKVESRTKTQSPSAEQPRDWGYPIMISSLVVGLALIATAILMRRRQN